MIFTTIRVIQVVEVYFAQWDHVKRPDMCERLTCFAETDLLFLVHIATVYISMSGRSFKTVYYV